MANEKDRNLRPRIRLKPSLGRVVAYFVTLLAAFLLPTVAGLLFASLGPAPYLLEPEALTAQWQGGVVTPEGGAVRVQTYDSETTAREAADALGGEIPFRSWTQSLHISRYTRSDNGRHGLIVPVGPAVVQIEAPDRDQVDRVLAGLPFVKENPETNSMFVLLDEHFGALLLGIGIYMIPCVLLFTRGAAWAGRIRPPRGIAPLARDALRARLLEINGLDLPFAIRENRRGYLIAGWRLADANWLSVLEKGGLRIAHSVKMKLDRDRPFVRAVDFSRTVRWSAGVARLGWSFSFFRGIVFYQTEAETAYSLFLRDGGWAVDRAYQYQFDANEFKKPVIEAVVTSGWTWQPVISFWRFLGG